MLCRSQQLWHSGRVVKIDRKMFFTDSLLFIYYFSLFEIFVFFAMTGVHFHLEFFFCVYVSETHGNKASRRIKWLTFAHTNWP